MTKLPASTVGRVPRRHRTPPLAACDPVTGQLIRRTRRSAARYERDRFREVGDRHAGLADHAFDITPLLELAERQATDHGLGDLPYPPDYPKMPGEPMRVQPSRARRPTSENA